MWSKSMLPSWISIHAPREGGDNSLSTLGGKTIISIHAPREGGDTNALGSW